MPWRSLCVLCVFAQTLLFGADRAVDPTFLYRHLSDVPFEDSDVTTDTCRYRPLFAAGGVVRGVARYGELSVNPKGKCKTVEYAAEEQIYYVLEGEGEAIYREQLVPIETGDFMYFAPGSQHSASNASSKPLRILVMGFKTPKDLEHGVPVKLPIANESEAKLQVVGNHPPTTLYRLLLGATTSQRDLLSVGHTVTSLFTMEFAPGGTNHPHHHAREEEVYILLEGEGEMVAGGGADGVENRRPATPGDSYFYRLNATVGFYASGKAKILAVRSVYP